MASRMVANIVTVAGSSWDRCGGREVCVDESRSSWHVSIPTLGGGIVAHVRANHITGALWVACADADGVWYRTFETPDDYAEWLDHIRAGEAVTVRDEAMPIAHREATFKPRKAVA